MPYIENSTGRREELIETLEPINQGELNFLLYYQALDFVERMGINYHILDDVVTAYEGVMQQLYSSHRRGYAYPDYAPLNSQDLHGVMYHIVFNYMSRSGAPAPIGTVRLSQAEFIREVVSPYEDKKKQENGEVRLKFK